MRRPVTQRALALLLATFSAALLVGGASKSLAAPIAVPTGLNPGDEYRLAFVTSTTRDATSSNIADYNAFVTAAADAVPELLALGTTWTAIGSTPTVDARDNTSTNPFSDGVGVPIYLLNDTLLVNGNADLWDWTLLNPLFIDEHGGNAFAVWAWTGSDAGGVGNPGRELGGLAGLTTMGSPRAVDARWIRTALDPAATSSLRLYAISGTISFVPEPGTGTLLTLGLVALAAVRRHRLDRTSLPAACRDSSSPISVVMSSPSARARVKNLRRR